MAAVAIFPGVAVSLDAPEWVHGAVATGMVEHGVVATGTVVEHGTAPATGTVEDGTAAETGGTGV